MVGRRFELEDLIDVELQLLRDRDLDRDERAHRDRRIGLTLDADRRARSPAERKALLADWARAVRGDKESLGEQIVSVIQALGWLLVLAGVLSGVGTAAAVLAYDGTHPVNVVHFLAVFVGLQLVLLALFVLSATLWRLGGRLTGARGVYRLVRLALTALGGLFERRMTAERRALLTAARGQLAASRSIYGGVERWLLVSLAQRFGLAFNLGALGTCLYLVAFSDLAFAWQTTLSWSAEEFHRLVSLIAAPWSWAYPEGAPSLEVVRVSRYFRLDGSFGTEAQLLGQWWRFLVLSLVVYGVLPRLALWSYSTLRAHRAVTGLRLDHGDIASLLDRLASPLVEIRAAEAEGPGEARASQPGVRSPIAAQAATVILYGDIPIAVPQLASLVEKRFGWRVAAQHPAGVDGTADDDQAIAAIPRGRDPIVVVVEAFEAPTREAKAFVQRLRAAVGRDRPIVIALLDGAGPGEWAAPRADDERMWLQHMTGLGDPYLRVEGLVA